MLQRFNHRTGHYLLLLALAWCLFFANLGGPSLWDLDEGRNSTCFFEMMEAGNWVIPTFNGLLRPDKPALLYWLQIAACRCFGVNEFAARLPSALAALATVLLCYELARSMFTPSTGLIAGIIVAATPMLCGAGRFANPDALLNLFVVLTLALFWMRWDRPQLWWFMAIGAAEGFGALAKGAVAVVLPVSIIALFFFWQRRTRTLWDRRQMFGVLAFMLVAVPWYLRVSVETKGMFARGFFLEHHVSRFVSTMENHRGGVWYYPLVIVLGTIPWSVFLGPALWFGAWSMVRCPSRRFAGWWSAAAESAAPSDQADADQRRAAYRLLGCWIAMFLLFFSVSATKLPNYALPVLAPTAILIARFLDRWRLGELALARWVLPASLVCLALTGAGMSAGLLAAGGAFPVDVMHGQALPALRPWAMVGGLLIAGGLGGAWCVRTGRRAGLIVSVAAAGVPLLALIGAYGVTVIEPHKAPRTLVEEVGALRRGEDIRVVAWQLDHLPSLNFYVQRNVHLCERDDEVRDYLAYPLPVYVFLPVSEWEHLRPTISSPCRELSRHLDLYKRDDVVVITNR
jgi:4-amino-4-deoxy-L-arabinose transferase-like glycosyltransferase